MTTGLASRAVRAATFAAVCVAAAAAGHALVSGAGFSPLALGSAFAGTASAAWWLAGRERGAFAVTGATVVTQFLLHLLFSLTEHHPALTAAGAAPGRIPQAAHPGHSPPDAAGAAASAAQLTGDAAAAVPVGPEHTQLTGLAGLSPFCHGWAMLLAHVLAAVVCGLWLWRGERAAFRFGRALAAAVFVPLRTAWSGLVAGPWRRPTRCLARTCRVRRLRQMFLRHVVVGRGPPVGVTLG
ncbi:hypothetical protein ACMA1D_25875 [Streptomyces sp. 796.1]|uniref:hypothetical protein n=1 Tax=Streptomyces sp. 796.1 TaxID=3163029 RepID=UPI0039C905F0